MPVIRTNEHSMGPGHRPEWSGVTSAGIFLIPTEGARFDTHYHDCHEYWLIFRGKAKIRTEGQDFYIQKGDIVCTRAGDEHDMLEIYEELEGYWFEDATPAGGRTGHLHQDAEKARGHEVPHKPLPPDFPA